MGPGDGHARRRHPPPHLLLLLLQLLVLHPRGGASAAGLPPPCPTYCVCNVTVELFFMVTCVRASLHEVPRALPRKESTTVLDLQQNELHKLRESALDGFSQLQVLYLNQTQLKEISEKAFRQCAELRSVFLSGNELKQIPSLLFKINHRLQFVDLSRNPLFLPPQAPFLVSRSLLILNLSDTRLSEVPPASFTGLPKLKLLDLRANLLHHVELRAVNFLINATLLLHDNPLHCDCTLLRMWRWQQSTAPPTPTASPTEPQEDSPMCNEPESLRGISLDVMVNRLSCDQSEAAGLTSVYVMIGVAALLAVAVVALAAVTAVRWCTRKRDAARGVPAAAAGRRGFVWCRPKRLAPPVGEYIEVVPESTAPMKPGEEVDAIYETVEENKQTGSRALKSEGGVAVRDTNDDRYVTEFTRCTYVPPSIPARFAIIDEPFYVNMKGPQLPARGCSNESSSKEEAPPLPSARSPEPRRPCSVTLLEGCDFYEVVD